VAIPRDAIVGIALFVVAVLYWFGADAIPESPLADGVGADGLPKTLAYALGVLSLALIARSFALEPTVGAPTSEERAADRHAHKRAAGMFLVGILYLVALPYLGYALSIVLLVGSAAWYNGKAPGPTLFAVAIGTAVAFYFLFVRFLGIGLPPGLWPSLGRMIGI